jgi:hypothetical protein
MICSSGAPLKQARTGRKCHYCSRRCKRRNERKRAAVSATVSPPEEPVSASRRRFRTLPKPAIMALDDEPHFTRTWPSAEAYFAARRNPFGQGGFMHDSARYGGDPQEEA